jgi:transposase
VQLPDTLPDDVKEYIKELAQTNIELTLHIQKLEESKNQSISKIEKEITSKQARILQLEKLVSELKRSLFGKKSEKFDPTDYLQSRLFNEAEFGLDDEEGLYEGHSETVHVKSFSRKKSGRKPIPDNIPRKEIIHDISDEEKICHCGAHLTKIGEEVSEKFGIIPEQVYAEKHIRFKYACKNCEGDERDEAGKIVVTAALPPQLLPQSILTPELFAYIQTAKFVDHIPFYRLSKILSRHGVEISRATFCNWSIGVYEKYEHLFSFIKEFLFEGKLLQIDETTLQVHNEEGRPNTSKSYMWAIRGGPPNQLVIKYIYRETRSAEFLVKYLSGYEGTIQTDGYKSYDSHFKSNKDILHAGCMAHARREFEKCWNSNKDPFAGEILNQIKKLYQVEKEIRELGLHKKELYSEIVNLRQEKSKPVLEAIFNFISEYQKCYPVNIGAGGAVAYTLGQWDKLTLYLFHGEIYIDNNYVENAIRPFVLGRKNWLFSDSPRGAHASAFWFSLIETAKANNREPFKFLSEFMQKLPYAKSVEDSKTLFAQAIGWS